jgi:hypothetical protein
MKIASQYEEVEQKILEKLDAKSILFDSPLN